MVTLSANFFFWVSMLRICLRPFRSGNFIVMRWSNLSSKALLKRSGRVVAAIAMTLLLTSKAPNSVKILGRHKVPKLPCRPHHIWSTRFVHQKTIWLGMFSVHIVKQFNFTGIHQASDTMFVQVRHSVHQYHQPAAVQWHQSRWCIRCKETCPG